MNEKTGEQQIWQRVFAPPQPKREDLRPLLLYAAESAAVFAALTNVLAGPNRELAKKLHTGQLETVACLRGMQKLSGSLDGPAKPVPQPKEPAVRLLEKAWHRANRAMTEYTARSLDQEFGTVFQILSQQEGQRSAAIARLLGMVT